MLFVSSDSVMALFTSTVALAVKFPAVSGNAVGIFNVLDAPAANVVVATVTVPFPVLFLTLTSKPVPVEAPPLLFIVTFATVVPPTVPPGKVNEVILKSG